MRELIKKLRNFFYYGWVGKDLWDFDASGVYPLIHAHIKRVNAFMKSDDTHLAWNDDEKNNLRRKLSEFEELSRQVALGDLANVKYKEDLNRRYKGGWNLSTPLDSRAQALMRLNWRQEKGKRDRYNYLFTKYIRQWWD